MIESRKLNGTPPFCLGRITWFVKRTVQASKLPTPAWSDPGHPHH